MSKIFIDTNIYSDAMRGIERAVAILQTAGQIFLSPIVVGELLGGFKQGNQEEKNKLQLNSFISKERVTLVAITSETADRYSFIYDQLKRDGTPIPTNDLWIAASVMEHGAQLATHDSHFKKIKGLYLI